MSRIEQEEKDDASRADGIMGFRNIELLKLPDRSSGISFLLCGSTRSGKSTIMNYLYENVFKHHITVLHTNSLQNAIYKPLLTSCAVAETYHPELIQESYKINKHTENTYEILHIIDDVVDKKNDPMIKSLLTIMRNSRISAIITGQSLTIFNNIARGNINYVFLGYLNSDSAIEQVIKAYLISYLPRGMKMDDKIRAYRRLTGDHFWLVIDNIHGDVFRTKLSSRQLVL